jgi:prepilin signal peptidase PulO-like enzyme (type II secretory pathway)
MKSPTSFFSFYLFSSYFSIGRNRSFLAKGGFYFSLFGFFFSILYVEKYYTYNFIFFTTLLYLFDVPECDWRVFNFLVADVVPITC